MVIQWEKNYNGVKIATLLKKKNIENKKKIKKSKMYSL